MTVSSEFYQMWGCQLLGRGDIQGRLGWMVGGRTQNFTLVPSHSFMSPIPAIRLNMKPKHVLLPLYDINTHNTRQEHHNQASSSN